jgi:hypothetical protein
VRIWSIHPKYLDAAGLVALWREGLLAQAVLRGATRGYTRHPQLDRFREQSSPVGSIASYLRAVQEEATSRGYRFARERISRGRSDAQLVVTRGQIEYEWEHLLRKLRARAPEQYERVRLVDRPRAHPMFRIVRGGIAAWERPGPL